METDEEKPDERDLLCGWRSFRPKALQKLNTPKWFLVFLTIYSFMQGKQHLAIVTSHYRFGLKVAGCQLKGGSVMGFLTSFVKNGEIRP